jgi:hypothetical protein
LQTVAEIAMMMPKAGMISGCRLQESSDGRVFVAQTDWLHAWPLYILGIPHFPQEATFFSREIWNAVGSVDEELTYFFDVAFFARALGASDCLALTNAPLSKMTVYPQMKTLRDDPEKKAWEMHQLNAKYMPSLFISRMVTYLLRTRYDRLVRGLLCHLLRAQQKIWVVDYSPVASRWVPYRP